jgi:hypothetical protein
MPIALTGMNHGTAKTTIDRPGPPLDRALRLVSGAEGSAMPREAALGLAGAWARILAREAEAESTVRVTVNGEAAAARSDKRKVAALRPSARATADARNAA